MFWDAPGARDGVVRVRRCSTAARARGRGVTSGCRRASAPRSRRAGVPVEPRGLPASVRVRWSDESPDDRLKPGAGLALRRRQSGGRARRRSAAARRRRSRCARRARARAARRRRRPRRGGRRRRTTAASASSCTDFGSRPSSPVGRTSPQAWMKPESSSHANSVFCSSVSRGISRCSACESTASISTSG